MRKIFYLIDIAGYSRIKKTGTAGNIPAKIEIFSICVRKNTRKWSKMTHPMTTFVKLGP